MLVKGKTTTGHKSTSRKVTASHIMTIYANLMLCPFDIFATWWPGVSPFGNASFNSSVRQKRDISFGIENNLCDIETTKLQKK